MSYQIRNDKGKTIAMFDGVEQSSAYVKHHCPDGIYQVIGPDTDCIFEREGGIVYPTAGTVDGQRLPPRTLAEAKEFFGQPKGGVQ